MRNFSAAFKEAINKEASGEVFLYLLELSHPDLASTIRLVNNYEDIVSNGETYSASAFQFTPPTQGEGEYSPAQLLVDNTDRVLVESLRLITTPIKVNAKVVLASDTNVIDWEYPELQLQNVSYNVNSISGEVLYMIYLGYNLSTTMINNTGFPGLAEWM